MRWIKPNVILELLAQIISKPCQYILKTKKGLGHDVSCGVFNMSATQGLRFIVQSNKGTTQNIEKEIDTFVDSISVSILISYTNCMIYTIVQIITIYK